MMRALVNLLSAEQQWWLQAALVGVTWWALHMLAVELITGGLVMAWRRLRRRSV